MMIKRSSYSLGILAVLAVGAAQACINGYGSDLQGNPVGFFSDVGQGQVVALRDRHEVNHWVARSRSAVIALATAPTNENLNDIAIVLMHLGRARKAIEVLQGIERRRPGRYQTATNLGTAYELSGDNSKALEWIREGIRRNPESHSGSEWLHVLILERKLSAKSSRGAGTSVAGVEFGAEVIPKMPVHLPQGNNGRPVQVGELYADLQSQLYERTQFVTAPDPIVADLLFDAASLAMLFGPIETGAALYGMALEFGDPRQALITRRRSHIAAVMKARPVPKNLNALAEDRAGIGWSELSGGPPPPPPPPATTPN